MREHETRFDIENFKNACIVNPVYSWIWNSEITEELIREQIDEMQSVGIRAIYILPEPKEFRPDTMRTHMSPNYLSDEFFGLVKYAIAYATEKGIAMWLYDEGGWPSGCACGQITGKYPDTVAKKITEDGGYSYIASTNVTDVLDCRVMDEFIANTYEGYKKSLGADFGKTVKAIFTDEPTMQYPYYISDKDDFMRLTGYSLDKYIPVIFGENVDEYDADFKIEYIDYASRKFEEKYMIRLHEWCRANGILFTGHMDGDHMLCDYGKQAGNALRHLRHMDIPGVDAILRQIYPHNEDNTFFPRLASSAANQTGGNLALTESFAVYGNGLTFDEMRYVANYQFVRGINILNIMSITSGRDRCLSSQCRPHFVPQLPTYEYIEVFNEYISRMMYLCQSGQISVDTALYMPIRDAWVENNDAEASYTELGKKLESKQIYFDLIDDDFLCNAINENGALKMGSAEYKTVYIPETKYISANAVKALEKFKADGGSVYTDCEIHLDGLIKCNNRNIRAMKRIVGKDTLYFLFNESAEMQEITVGFDEAGHGYVLDCMSGQAEKLNKTISLQSGEMIAVLFTDKLLSVRKCPSVDAFIEITEFEKSIESVVCYDGEKYYKSDTADFDTPFSGTVRYTAKFSGTDKRLVELCGMRDCATVIINGRELATLAMSPYVAEIDTKYLQAENTLEILVSNTTAAAYMTADYSGCDPAAVGPYHKITAEFEKDSLGMGLKSVKLFGGV